MTIELSGPEPQALPQIPSAFAIDVIETPIRNGAIPHYVVQPVVSPIGRPVGFKVDRIGGLDDVLDTAIRLFQNSPYSWLPSPLDPSVETQEDHDQKTQAVMVRCMNNAIAIHNLYRHELKKAHEKAKP